MSLITRMRRRAKYDTSEDPYKLLLEGADALESAEVLAALPKGEPMTRDERQAAWAALRMIGDAIGELFGPIASLESEDASLLRGPEYHHFAEGLVEALQRVSYALPKGELVAWRWRAQSKTGMWTGWHDGRAPEPGRYKVYDGYTLHEQPLFAYRAALPKGDPAVKPLEWRGDPEWTDSKRGRTMADELKSLIREIDTLLKDKDNMPRINEKITVSSEFLRRLLIVLRNLKVRH